MKVGYRLATDTFGPAKIIRREVLVSAGPDPDGLLAFFAAAPSTSPRVLPPSAQAA